MNKYSNDLNAVVIIPARFKSSRLPGKPLIKILGIPMIVRVAKIASDAVGIENVYIATDDERIKNVVEDYNFSCIMTSDRCLTGTDRVSEAWSYLSKTKRYKYILNCQGDEPTLDPKIIIDTIEYMKKNPGYSVNCYASTNDEDKVESTNIIKMITDRDNFLIYASRSLIPGRKKRLSKQNETYKKQVAVYGFTTKDLKLFGPEKEKTAIEEIEDIEILRILEHGSNVLMKEVKNFKTAAVDVKEDIANVERILRKN